MEGGGIRLALMVAVGLLLIEIGLTGKLGSLLGSIIDPGSMAEPNGSLSSGGGNVQNTAPASNDAIVNTINKTFGVYASQAMRIANAESSMNSNAYNSISVGGSHAEGLFQILYPSTWNTTSQAANNPYDYKANTKAAFEIFQRDGFSWREWATAPGLGLS